MLSRYRDNRSPSGLILFVTIGIIYVLTGVPRQGKESFEDQIVEKYGKALVPKLIAR